MSNITSYFWGVGCISIYLIIVLVLLYACTVNIVQTSSHARAKEIADIVTKEDYDLSLKNTAP